MERLHTKNKIFYNSTDIGVLRNDDGTKYIFNQILYDFYRIWRIDAIMDIDAVESPERPQSTSNPLVIKFLRKEISRKMSSKRINNDSRRIAKVERIHDR